MDDDMIDALSRTEARGENDRFRMHPHPVEFDMYYKA